jgi:hypothetical protein
MQDIALRLCKHLESISHAADVEGFSEERREKWRAGRLRPARMKSGATPTPPGLICLAIRLGDAIESERSARDERGLGGVGSPSHMPRSSRAMCGEGRSRRILWIELGAENGGDGERGGEVEGCRFGRPPFVRLLEARAERAELAFNALLLAAAGLCYQLATNRVQGPSARARDERRPTRSFDIV